MTERIVITGAISLLPEPLSHKETCDRPREIKHRRQTAASAQLLQLCQQLFHDAGLDNISTAGEETGLVSGACYGCMSVTQNILTTLREKGPRAVDAIEFAKATHSFPLSAISIEFSLLGPAAAVVSGELAAMDALMMARDWLLAERCQRVIVVGYESFSPLLQAHRQQTSGDGHDSDHMNVLLLETESSARARDARVLAEVLGLKRFSGSHASMVQRWVNELQHAGAGSEACRILSISAPQSAAESLQQDIDRHYAPSPDAIHCGSRQLSGTTTIMQLAEMIRASLSGEWILNTFAAAEGAMIHLRLNR
ncbi:beta-ketoacyl synthase N-terminal-like domain-containing protein [Enterobacteriaceae bacterium ESL0689]|nr:beta-ketoacyl synthase N-terminal-like domain-containing protein [Enterobacteriaceae bacterium ESL0689]